MSVLQASHMVMVQSPSHNLEQRQLNISCPKACRKQISTGSSRAFLQVYTTLLLLTAVKFELCVT